PAVSNLSLGLGQPLGFPLSPSAGTVRTAAILAIITLAPIWANNDNLPSYSCRVVGARNVESNCRLGLRSVLRHCAVGADRLRPLVGHAVGISASFFRRRSNPHPRRYIDHRRSARTCGFICPFCAG